jgi:hypothetical protein
MPFHWNEPGNINHHFAPFIQRLVAPEVVEVYWRVNDNGFFNAVALPVLHNRFFGVVTVAEDHVQLADSLLYPPFEQPQVNFPLKLCLGIVIMYFGKVDVCDVFFGFFEENWFKGGG